MTNFPVWTDLPTIDLYLDQVLLYINDLTSQFNPRYQKPLTAAMVNNYVKHGYVRKPIKKKYGKTQLAQLTVISLLKDVFSIQELTQAMMTLSQTYEKEDLFDALSACLNQRNFDPESEIPKVIQLACKTLHHYHATLDILQSMEDTNYEHD
ncbi:DUF1836 domain-containing protein [Streptococcus rifensis]